MNIWIEFFFVFAFNKIITDNNIRTNILTYVYTYSYVCKIFFFENYINSAQVKVKLVKYSDFLEVWLPLKPLDK